MQHPGLRHLVLLSETGTGLQILPWKVLQAEIDLICYLLHE